MTLQIYLGSDDGFKFLSPQNMLDPSSPVNLTSADTAQLRIYDVTEQPIITVAAKSADAATTLSVTASEMFADGASIAIRTDANTIHATTVASSDLDAGTITLTDALPGGEAAPYRERIWSFPGAAVYTLSAFGTPGTDPWGFRAGIADDHEGLYHEQRVVAHMLFDAGAGLGTQIWADAVVLRATT